MSWVRPLEEVAGDDVSAVGGKAAHLGELISAGFSVPTGFVITAEAFRAHYPNVSRESKPAALRELQADLLTSVDKQFTATFTNQNETVAVRSSAIGEDGAEHSFAGQHATYYYIRREGLGKAVVHCWLSLHLRSAQRLPVHGQQRQLRRWCRLHGQHLRSAQRLPVHGQQRQLIRRRGLHRGHMRSAQRMPVRCKQPQLR